MTEKTTKASCGFPTEPSGPCNHTYPLLRKLLRHLEHTRASIPVVPGAQHHEARCGNGLGYRVLLF